MADERLKLDGNFHNVVGGVTDDSNTYVTALRVDPTTKYLKVMQVALDKTTDDITIYANTAADGSGTAKVPLVDSSGHLQVDVLSTSAGSASTVTIYNKTITDTTEQSQVLPANTKYLKVFMVDGDGWPIGYAWDIYFISGSTTTILMPGSGIYEKDNISISAGTVYAKLRGGTATAIIEVWT